jgi:hypothetical protein
MGLPVACYKFTADMKEHTATIFMVEKMTSKQRARNRCQAWRDRFLHCLFFDPEDGGRFLGKVTKFLSDYTASNSTRHHSSQYSENLKIS